jgi:membrane protease YdiL (CAAX protease family)
MGFGKRPTGVTVLAILAILMVLVCALAAVVLLMMNSMLANEGFVQSLINDYGITQQTIDDLIDVALPYGVVTMAYAVVFTLLAYSLLTGAKWGWGLGVAFAIFLIAYSIVIFVLSPSIGNVPSLVIQVLSRCSSSTTSTPRPS